MRNNRLRALVKYILYDMSITARVRLLQALLGQLFLLSIYKTSAFSPFFLDYSIKNEIFHASVCLFSMF